MLYSDRKIGILADPIMSLQGADIVEVKEPHICTLLGKLECKYLRSKSEIIVSEVPRLNCF